MRSESIRRWMLRHRLDEIEYELGRMRGNRLPTVSVTMREIDLNKTYLLRCDQVLTVDQVNTLKKRLATCGIRVAGFLAAGADLLETDNTKYFEAVVTEAD